MQRYGFIPVEGWKFLPFCRIIVPMWLFGTVRLRDTEKDTVLYTYSSSCYEHKQSNCDKYGRLYTKEAAMDACPTGWHLPTRGEWMDLMYDVGAVDDSSLVYRLKEKSGWEQSEGPTYSELWNVVSFSALAAGGFSVQIRFNKLGVEALFWASSEKAVMAFTTRDWLFARGDPTSWDQFSVRCVQD